MPEQRDVTALTFAKERTADYHGWHVLVAYPESCVECREQVFRSALNEIAEMSENATVANAQFVAREALR